MVLSNYCKNKGMTKNEFMTFKNNIEASAVAILEGIKQNYKIGNGVYHPINEILSNIGDADIRCFIIDRLKALNVEFINNNMDWRY